MSDRDKPALPAFWYRLYPELRHFKTREDLRRLKRDFRRERFTRRHARLLGFLTGLAASLVSMVSVRWLISLGLGPWLALVINAVCLLVIGTLGSFYLWHRPYVRFVRRHLQERGVPVCVACGYDLRGQTAPRCPECGREFDPVLIGRTDEMG